MLDSFKLTTCLNFWYHQLANLSQKALDTVQLYSRWFIVCFSVAHREQMSLSVMPARKRLDLVGKMWCIILYWKAINFESLVLVIRKGNVFTLWMLSLEKP